jgi:hypothetical protein
MMPNFRDWPNVAIPAFCSLPETGWIDRSWRRDDCARIERKVDLVQENYYPRLRLWVEADAPKERESPESPKYQLEMLGSEEDELSFEGCCYSGESAEECAAKIAEVLKICEEAKDV